MNKIVDHLFVLNGDGTVKDLNGNYATYRTYIKERQSNIRAEKQEVREESKTHDKTDKEKRKLSFNEKYEFEKLDKEIPELETRKEELSEKLNTGDLPYEEIEKISNELTQLVSELDEKTMRWMELAEFA